MAGAGRKVFTAGDVLTASQVQDYLQDQAVMVFATTAARSLAIATPSEGMVAITTDTDILQYYNGSAWVSALPIGAWTSYTPVWGSNGTQPVLGNSTISGAFAQIGKTVHFKIALSLLSGGSFSVGTGSRYTFTTPTSITGTSFCSGYYSDASLNTFYPLTCRIETSSIDVSFFTAGPTTITGNVLGAASPVVPATGDFYSFSGTYQAV
jgi:hypothetical protein